MGMKTSAAQKKRKRREKQYEFMAFADRGYPIKPMGPFRENIRVFLRECSEIEDYTVQGMPIWRTYLVLNDNRDLRIPLYTIEESVEHSKQPLCNHCICTGWSHHFVSKRRYHLIIPGENEWNKRLENGVFDIQTHMLHGLIHCNGFGHLLCINGSEGGSNCIRGREIMDLWDRICTNLRTRKISVEDESKKHLMDLRLLYGVTYGHAWFGRWGYKFYRGSFGVNQYKYDKAIEILSSIALDQIVCDMGNTEDCKEIERIICFYRDLSETHLITIRDLLRFMLTLKSFSLGKRKSSNSSVWPFLPRKAKKAKPLTNVEHNKNKDFANVVDKNESRWSSKRLEQAKKAIFDALKEMESRKVGNGGIPRHELRESARKYVRDTGLVDFVIKSLNNVIVGIHIVVRDINPKTGIFEYSIRELSERVLAKEPASEVQETYDIYSDIAYIYSNVLLGDYPESELIGWASRTLLDSKHYLKEWPLKREQDDYSLRLICRVMPSWNELESELTRDLAPGELVLVPLNANADEIKEAIESVMRDTNCGMENFEVSEFEEENMDLGFSFSGISEVYVRGKGIDWSGELIYEGGPKNWTVRCEGGAMDDDGESMVACDVCEVWQHERCCGINNTDPNTPVFMCSMCFASLVPPWNEHDLESKFSEASDDFLLQFAAEVGMDLFN